MTEFTGISTAFILGLFSMTHCIAMCGTVIGALTLSLPEEVRGDKRKMLPYVTYYNIGRLLSYATAGALVGWLSTPLVAVNGHVFLRYLSVIVMVAMGLYLAGWFPKFAKMEKLGAPVWRWLQPIGKRFIPVRTWRQAFFLGMVWGWLPCGLVYAGLAVAATSGNATQGAMMMMAFGVGTLPAVMGAGIFTGLIVAMGRAQYLRRIAGVLIIIMAVVTLLLPMDHGEHEMNGTTGHSAHEH
jgi:sulfite exporter TauE/SafE